MDGGLVPDAHFDVIEERTPTKAPPPKRSLSQSLEAAAHKRVHAITLLLVRWPRRAVACVIFALFLHVGSLIAIGFRTTTPTSYDWECAQQRGERHRVIPSRRRRGGGSYGVAAR